MKHVYTLYLDFRRYSFMFTILRMQIAMQGLHLCFLFARTQISNPCMEDVSLT